MPKELPLYKHPWTRIKEFLQMLQENHRFSEEERSCEPLHVFEDKVTFKIHRKLNELIKVACPPGGPIEYFSINGNDDHRMIVISSEGVESYFFMRLIHRVIAKLSGASYDPVVSNIEFIQTAIKAAIEKGDRDFDEFPIPRITFNDGVWRVVLTLKEGCENKFEGKNVDFILRDIGQQIPAILLAKD